MGHAIGAIKWCQFHAGYGGPKGFTEKVHDCEDEWCTTGANG